MPTYGWQSKRYLFGSNRAGDVATNVQDGLPARLLGVMSHYIGTGDTVKLIARLGGPSSPAGLGTVTVAATTLTFTPPASPPEGFSFDNYLAVGYTVVVGANRYVLVSRTSATQWVIEGGQTASNQSWSYVPEVVLYWATSSAIKINRLGEEIDLTLFPNSRPSIIGDWYLSFRLEITTDYLDPSPESPDWPFVNNTNVTLYLYRNLRTQRFEMHTDPVNPNSDTGTPEYLPLNQVQTVFFFGNTPLRFRAATVVSDNNGKIELALPTGDYNIEFHGGGIVQSDWVEGFTVGAGDYLTPWKGTSTSGVSQAAEFNSIKNEFSTLYWPGYVVAEDFSPERAQYRDENAEVNTYGNNYAWQLFGRVFAGKSFVDFVGIAVDPPPE